MTLNALTLDDIDDTDCHWFNSGHCDISMQTNVLYLSPPSKLPFVARDIGVEASGPYMAK